MTDEAIETRAKRLLGDLSVRMLSMSLDAMAYGATNDDKHTDGLIAIVAAALRAARNEAIEEAAKVADSEETHDPRHAPHHVSTEQVATVIGVVQVTRESIARRIRSLSTHPAGGHDV